MSDIKRPVLRYHGGKFLLAPWIISHFPPHEHYFEGFGGGGSILMQKHRSRYETYNDRWDTVVNVFQVLRDPVVRRLTPLECERLQGFPFHYTLIPPTADSPRYEALGNSMAVPVMRWIGQRIDLMNKHLKNSLIRTKVH